MISRLVLPALFLSVLIGSARFDGDSTKKEPAAPKESAEPFRIPDDAAGKLLAKQLPPTARPGSLPEPTRTPPASPTLVPVDSIPLVLGTPPEPTRLTRATTKAPRRPEFRMEEPFAGGDPLRPVPAEPTFEIGKRIRIFVDDVAIPPAMPVIGVAVIDRVSVEDATLEASTAAVHSEKLPERTTPTPFVRERPPEPFENPREKTPPLEESLPK